jgi:hypothetical protein
MAFKSAWHEFTGVYSAMFLGRELNHSLVLKWELFGLEWQRDPVRTKGFWEYALRNLEKARDSDRNEKENEKAGRVQNWRCCSRQTPPYLLDGAVVFCETGEKMVYSLIDSEVPVCRFGPAGESSYCSHSK